MALACTAPSFFCLAASRFVCSTRSSQVSNFFSHVSELGSSAPSGYGSGWDLIVPQGWGRAFWLALVWAGAHAAGLMEREALCLELVLFLSISCRPFPLSRTKTLKNG